MKLPHTLAAMTALLVLAAPPVPAGASATAMSKEEAEALIFERQQVMESLGRDSERLGDIAAGLQPADGLAKVTRSIADSAKDVRRTFTAQVPGGRSKPEVWSNWHDYSARLDVFEQKTEEMAQLGAAGNLPAVTTMLADALPCKQCHDVYRAPKK